MVKYAKAYKELYEILKFVPRENVEKLPKQLLEMIEEQKDDNHVFKIDHFANPEQQEMLDETRAFLAIFYKEYWADELQKQQLKYNQVAEIKEENVRSIQKTKIEEEKEESCNSQTNKIVEENVETEKNQTAEIEEEKPKEQKENLQLVVKKENIFIRFIHFIKKWLKRI